MDPTRIQRGDPSLPLRRAMHGASAPELLQADGQHRGARSRLTAVVGTAWATFMGVLPHVLHHVGPLAGAAIVAGTTGTVVFGAAAFVLTVPLLLRVHRHCGNWRLPGMLLALFVGMWLVSTFLVGPWVRDELVQRETTQQERSAPTAQAPVDGEHGEHHE